MLDMDLSLFQLITFANKKCVCCWNFASRFCIVKKIFKLALDGISSRNIAKILNEEKIPTPSKRKSELTNLDFEYSIIRTAKKPRPTWTNGNVIDVLANENYTETYTFNMQDKSVLNPSSFKFKPKEEWGRVENNHGAIIPKEDFEKVQKIKEKNLCMKGKIPIMNGERNLHYKVLQNVQLAITF